jgi:hypothetical protein
MTEDKQGQPATPEPSPGSERLGADEVQAWKGFKLGDMEGATVGRVEGAYVDSESGEPEWLLARMGKFGHHCLIPARDAVAAGGHIWVPYTRDQVRKAPRQDPGKPLEREAEQQLLAYYGVGAGEAGRGADLAQRDAGAVTARPHVEG